MSSTDSLPAAEADQAALREGLELGEGVRRLGRMIGLESVQRNLQNEDEAAREDIGIHQRALWGEDAASSGAGESEADAMRIMAARDVHVYPPQSTQQAPQQQPQTKTGLLTRYGLPAALAAAGVGAGAIGTYLATRPDNPTTSVQPADESQWNFGLLPPQQPAD